jgi:predicted nucleotide-binding protein
MEDNISQLQKINKLRDELENLQSQIRTGFHHKIGESEFQKWDYFHRKSGLIIKSIFGENSQSLDDWLKIEIPEDPDIEDDEGFSIYNHKQRIAEDKMENQLEIMAKEIVTSKTNENNKPIRKQKSYNRVFIVHGTDHEPVNELRVILKEVNLQPLILEELPCASKTIVEKLETYSDVDFAFVIITPDDAGGRYLGKVHDLDSFEKLNLRARQNVILEFGYFIGKLTRSKVCCLIKGKVETPSDMAGIAYIQFNNSLKEIEKKILNELEETGLIKTDIET